MTCEAGWSVTILLCVAHLLVDTSSIVLLLIRHKLGKELLKILPAESRQEWSTLWKSVSIAGPTDYSNVQATSKLENVEGQVNYSFLASGSTSKNKWTVLKSKLSVSTSPAKVLVYLEGPPEGIDILASYFSIVPLTADPEFTSKPVKEE